jgi:hypothetical protein
LIARILIEVTDEKEWQAAKVIAMEMAQKNDIQSSRIKARPLHGQQARWAAVHEKKPVGGLNEISALVAPAVTKSIATAKNMKFHDSILCDFLYARALRRSWALAPLIFSPAEAYWTPSHSWGVESKKTLFDFYLLCEYSDSRGRFQTPFFFLLHNELMGSVSSL